MNGTGQTLSGRIVYPKAWLGILAAGVLISGCATTDPAEDSTKGTISGRVLQYGGPFVNGSPAAAGTPGKGTLVTVEQNGRTVASTKAAADGRFTFSLPPGRYTIKGCDAVTVEVSADRQTVQDVTCPVP